MVMLLFYHSAMEWSTSMDWYIQEVNRMKLFWKIVIIVIAILTYILIGVTSTDEGGADNAIYDAAYDSYVDQYGETAGDYLFSKDQQ